MSSGSFKNDATLKLLGVEYQKLIAIERCFAAFDNEIIYIECKGDVANDEESIEVKHHVDKNNLSNNSTDFWKTFKNYIENYEVIKDFNRLILHTTSEIPTTSIFYDWKSKDINTKFSIIKEYTPSNTAKPFVNVVQKADDNILKEILSKFELLSSQPKIKEKWEELKTNNALLFIGSEYRNDALRWLTGYISDRMKLEKWEIDINDFKRDIKHGLSKYISDQILFPKIPYEANNPKDQSEYLFLKKMDEVSLSASAKEVAVNDYLRAELSKVKLLQRSPTLGENLDEYDKKVERNIREAKEEKAIDLNEDSYKTGECDKVSQKLYYHCITSQPEQIEGVKGTEKYYKNGCIHSIVEQKLFEWKYRNETQ